MSVTEFDSRTPFKITLSVPADVNAAGEVELTEENFVPVGTGAVQTVFGRNGAVVAVAGDYTASLVDNDSGVSGATVGDALDTLDGATLKVANDLSDVDSISAARNNLGVPNRALTEVSGANVLGNYADDAAAAVGGVAVGELYRTGSIVKVRVA